MFRAYCSIVSYTLVNILRITQLIFSYVRSIDLFTRALLPEAN